MLSIDLKAMWLGLNHCMSSLPVGGVCTGRECTLTTLLRVPACSPVQSNAMVLSVNIHLDIPTLDIIQSGTIVFYTVTQM